MKKRKKSRYQKSLFIFCAILSFLGTLFLAYVFYSLVLYERGLVDNYIEYLINSNKLVEEIDSNVFTISSYEKDNVKIKDGLKRFLKNEEITTKKDSQKSTEESFVYELKKDDIVLVEVSLKKVKTSQKMGILQINEWKIEDVKTNLEKGIYNYEISVPINYQVFINDKLTSDEEIIKYSDVEDLENLTNHIEIQKQKMYSINGLVYKPKIKVLDENKKEVIYKLENNKINVRKDYIHSEKYDDAKKYIKNDFDVLSFAKNWSLFLTDDLGGSYHGFYKLTPYLIKDSIMYERAYDWSHNVDITFVSSHRLKNPIFTNESVKNCVIYNDNAFSCEVYLEKNMIISGKEKVDIMHERLFFIYYEDGYKLVDINAV